jgi:hypothetical protein
VSEAWIASRLIRHGHGAIAIDPKGDGMLRGELKRAAESAGREFLEWTPTGPCAYNPYATGSDSEIADKALAGEVFTEPHYLRMAQRYLGHAVRAMRAAEIEVTPAALMEHLDPDRLEVTARKLPEEHGDIVQAYLDSLSEPQRRGLAGTRDRLSILPESDVGCWLNPEGRPAIDLRAAIESRGVVYFALESDRMPLLAHRQNVPASAELVADIAGSRAGWVITQGTEQGLLGQRGVGRGTRRRDYEREVHPSEIMRLGVGEALVVVTGARQQAVLAGMCHPREG